MHALRDPAVRLAALGGALWAAATGVALVAVTTGAGTLVGAGLALGYVGDVLVHAGDPRVPRWLGDRDLAAPQRALLREGVAVGAWVLLAEPAADVVAVVVGAVLAVHAAHLGYRVLTSRHAALRRGRLSWRNLTVDGVAEGPVRLPPILPGVGSLSGRRVLLVGDVLLVVGAWASWSTGGAWPVVAGAAGTVAWALGCVGLAVRRSLVVRRLPSAVDDNERLRAAVERLAPEVVVYFSGPVGTTYQLNVWLETFGRLRRPALLLVREAHHLEDMLPTDLPVVVAPRAQDVEFVQTPSMLLALYPTTVVRNNHMIRLRGLRHVFINHGDGDKAVTYSPLHRVFDEIWVAGRAACDRYLTRGEGVRADQLVVVGRPQLAHLRLREPRATDGPVTVLYAPTWEGNFDGVDYSSVASMGERLVRALLEAEPRLRVLVKPHPATGNRLPGAAAGRAAVERLARAAPHAVLVGSEPEALYDAFNACDVLVADVSSVVADFLATRKPYVTTNPRDLPVEDLHRDFPSTGGGAVVGPSLDGLLAAVREAAGADPFRERREALARYVLGEPAADPVGRFVDEVEAACERARARHERAQPAAGPGGPP